MSLENSPDVGPAKSFLNFLHENALILISPLGCSQKTSFCKIFNFLGNFMEAFKKKTVKRVTLSPLDLEPTYPT